MAINVFSLKNINHIISNISKNTASIFDDILNSPGKPLKASTKRTSPRDCDIQPGTNIITTPRSEFSELTKFESLDYLAKTVDIIGLGIKCKRDQITTYKWNIIPTDPSDTNDYSEDIKFCKNFFKKPDGKRSFRQWMNKQIYNMVVYDSISFFKWRNKLGDLIQIHTIDGKTLKPLIDKNGRRPSYPSVAYQQIIKGLPETNWTEKDIVYYPLYESIDNTYGTSVVETIMITLNTYLRSQNHELVFFTDGTSPFMGLLSWGDKEISGDQLKQVEASFNDFMSSAKNKMKMKLVPPGTDVVKTMEFKFNIDFKEQLIRIMCCGLNLKQYHFIKSMNRATAESLGSQQEDDTLTAELVHFEDIFSDIIENEFKMPHLKFEFDKDQIVDQKLIIDRNVKYVEVGIISADEVRMKEGLKPKGIDNMINTSVGLVKLGDDKPELIQIGIPIETNKEI